jgi:hypothetical protein
MTIFLRFAFGVILAGGLVVMRVGMPLLVEVIFIVGVGIIAAIWGVFSVNCFFRSATIRTPVHSYSTYLRKVDVPS